MACQFCGHKEAIKQAAPAPAAAPGQQAPQPSGNAGTGAMVPAASDQIREIPIEEGMRMAARGLGAQVSTIQCKDCGATVNVGQGERTTSCAFCGSKQVLSQETNQSAIRPESMLPFQIDKAGASTRFTGWLAKLWFRPNNLKKMASVEELGGVYVPYWTFASNTASTWTAQRGWHYYETESYTATENGKQVRRTRKVQRTRWEPASGWRRDHYEDVLVCAGKGLPEKLTDEVSKFDVKRLVAYKPEFLSGWRAESYAIELMPAWGTGQQKISSDQHAKCGRDVGGDTHQGLSVQTTFRNVTFKHVLLPVWIAAYRYNNKVFRFLVNGQTGDVVGEAPWSPWKIFFLVAAIAAVIGVIVFFVARSEGDTSSSPPSETPAMTATAPAATHQDLEPATPHTAPTGNAPLQPLQPHTGPTAHPTAHPHTGH